MTRSRLARAGAEILPVEATERFGDGGPTAAVPPPISNALLALVLFMSAEVMLFTGMISALVLFRSSSLVWPPPGQPMLPLGVTFANTAVLLASAVSMSRAQGAVRRGDLSGLRSGLLFTGALGTLFVAVQGYEWLGLVRHGLTLGSSTYGATFYTLIGLHAAHVVGAALWVLCVLAGAWRGHYTQSNHVGVQVCGVYWTFVVALWIVLFAVVYLA